MGDPRYGHQAVEARDRWVRVILEAGIPCGAVFASRGAGFAAAREGLLLSDRVDPRREVLDQAERAISKA